MSQETEKTVLRVSRKLWFPEKHASHQQLLFLSSCNLELLSSQKVFMSFNSGCNQKVYLFILDDRCADSDPPFVALRDSV